MKQPLLSCCKTLIFSSWFLNSQVPRFWYQYSLLPKITNLAIISSNLTPDLAMRSDLFWRLIIQRSQIQRSICCSSKCLSIVATESCTVPQLTMMSQSSPSHPWCPLPVCLVARCSGEWRFDGVLSSRWCWCPWIHLNWTLLQWLRQLHLFKWLFHHQLILSEDPELPVRF